MGRVSDARERLIEGTIDLLRIEGYGAVTVDSICNRARVKKGSFYHFFRSKDELVLAALDAHWEWRRPTLDRLFSPSVAPLERLRSYFADVFERQLELRARYGHFVGCLWMRIGLSAKQHPELDRKVQDILGRYCRYYESALRDAVARGEVRIDDVDGKAHALFAFMEGVLAQARVQDDPDLIRNLGRSSFEFLGIAQPTVRAA